MARGWKCIARHEGGTVIALAALPEPAGNGDALLAATAVGLFRSDDAGRHWAALGDRPLPLLSAVAPSSRFAENRMVYAGTRTGFHRSTDGGTWRQTLSAGHVLAIAVIPGADGDETVMIGTEADGILRSEDLGTTWTGANPGLLDRTVLALAFSPAARRDQTGFAATASGLYRTRNGGKAWRQVDLPCDEPAVQCLAISPQFERDRLVLAGTERDGLLRSDDAGATWEPVRGVPGRTIDAIAFSQRDAASPRIAVATPDGVALSEDGGVRWQVPNGLDTPAYVLAFIPDAATEILVAGLYRDGIARLPLAGPESAWSRANTGLHATALNAIVAAPAQTPDPILFVSGPDAGMRISRDGGHAWTNTVAGLGAVGVHSLAIASGDRRTTIFAATDVGVFRSYDNGGTWEAPHSSAELPAHLVTAVAIGGAVRSFAATAEGRLLASDDGGERWHSLDTPFAGTGIVSLACAHAADGTPVVYAGTAGAARSDEMRPVTLWRSPDAGRTWTAWMDATAAAATLPLTVTPPRLIVASGEPTAFIGLGSQVLQPRPRTWQTRGGVRMPLWFGPSLTSSDGVPVQITALAVSPNYRTDGTVFAATSAGIFRSPDDGRTFAAWNEGIAALPILAIAASDGQGNNGALVFALGLDGSVWRRTQND